MQQSVIFGNSKRVISDRGTAFISKDFDNYCKDQEIKHITIATGVSRGNGQVERIKRVIIPILTKLSAPNPAQWHKYINKAQQYINSTPMRSTGAAPYTLLRDTDENNGKSGYRKSH